MKRGYARVSTADQSLDMQLDALRKAECEVLYAEKTSGANHDRPELSRLLTDLQKGDHVVIWKLDRLGRSLQHLVNLVNGFKDSGVGFTSLTDNIDTSTSGGRFFFNIMASLAQFEREMISERTKAGLKAAKARGKSLGRPSKLSLEQMQQVAEWIKEGKPKRQIARLMKVSPATLYRHLGRHSES